MAATFYHRPRHMGYMNGESQYHNFWNVWKEHIIKITVQIIIILIVTIMEKTEDVVQVLDGINI